MNRINFDSELQNLIDLNYKNKVKPKLVLHSCCAPCSSTCIERLKDAFSLTVFFYNPNMDSDEEYKKRANEQIKLCKAFNVDYVICDYDSDSYYSAVSGLEQEKEGGKRCEKCFRLRLKKTAEFALQWGCDYFATTLTLSPLKNSDLINGIGKDIENELKIKYLATDFKKRGGYQRSIELSKEYDLYRQNYCGCIYSKKDREKSL